MQVARKRKFPQILRAALCLLPLLFSTYLHADTAEDMLHFEQRFIPLMLYTAEADSRSVIAASALMTQWYAFKSAHVYADSIDDLWGFDLVAIERGLLDGLRLVQAADYQPAYANLLQVRQRFYAMRLRHNIEFYPDNFIAVDASLQELQAKLQQQHADDVYAEIAAVQKAWNRMLPGEVNLYEYELGRQQIAYLQECLQKGQQLLSRMQQSFAAAEYAQLPALGSQMQQLYNHTYAIFAAAD